MSNFNKEIAELIEQVRSYYDVKNNWDGENGIPPNSSAIEDVIYFIEHWLPKNAKLPIPVLSSEGEVGLFWNKHCNCYIDIGFLGDGQISYFAENKATKKTINATVAYDKSNVPLELIHFIIDA